MEAEGVRFLPSSAVLPQICSRIEHDRRGGTVPVFWGGVCFAGQSAAILPDARRHDVEDVRITARGSPGRTRPQSPSQGSGSEFPDADHLDRLIHERLRLGIVSALAANAALTFTDLKRLLKTTDGNLSVHARKLEEAGYLLCTKTFEGRTPRTEFRLTAAGRIALEPLSGPHGSGDSSRAETGQVATRILRRPPRGRPA
jgi:DNA-binding HxlR family transcriptional regulator